MELKTNVRIPRKCFSSRQKNLSEYVSFFEFDCIIFHYILIFIVLLFSSRFVSHYFESITDMDLDSEIFNGLDSELSGDSDDDDYQPSEMQDSDTDLIGDSCVSESELDKSFDTPARRLQHTTQSPSTSEFEGFSDEGLIDLPPRNTAPEDSFMRN